MVHYLSPRLRRPSETLTVDEFLGRLHEGDHLDDHDRFMFIAELLAKVTGELAYVESYIRDLVETRKDRQFLDGYGDSSLMLGRSERYKLRLVKWTPIAAATMPNLNRVGLSYGYLHNHDFQIVTKGIFGDGYETDVFRTDATKMIGAIGENAALKFQGRFKLVPGAVMWYEQYHDAHDQLPPGSFSMSFNVIPVDPKVDYPQLSFRMPENKVAGFTRNRQGRVLSALALLCDFAPNDDTLSILTGAAEETNNLWLKRAIAALIAERWNRDFAEMLERFKVPITDPSIEVTADSFSVRHVR